MSRFASACVAAAIALGLSAGGARAQNVGVKLGASLSSFRVDGSGEGLERRTDFAGGGFIRFGFGHIGIQPEIFALRKGAEIESGSSTGADVRIGIEYIAVPILLHLPLTYGQSFAPYLFGGPEFAFEIGCEQSVGDVDADCDEPSLGEDALELKPIDIGLTAGGGFAFAMGPGAFLIEARYTWGLTNINDSAGSDASEVKNRSALVLAGYSIPIGRNY